MSLPLILFVCLHFSIVDGTFGQSPPSRVSPASTDDHTLEALIAESSSRAAAGDLADAERLLIKALDISPNSLSANLALGRIYLRDLRYPEAMERFEAILATNRASQHAREGEVTAATSLALASRRAGNQQAALLCLRHAREFLPDDPTLLRDLGIQAYDMHLLNSAAEALSAALAIAPEDPQSLYSLARVEAEQRRFPPAEKHFRAYLAARPDDASAHYGLGHLLQMQQRTDEAIAEFHRSLQLQPQQTESYYQLGQIALDRRQDDEAHALFERTLARAPEHGGALTGMGVIAFRRKDYAAGAEILQRAIRTSPEYQPAHFYLGLTLAKLNDVKGSKHELALAAELDRKQEGKNAPVEADVPPPAPR